MQDHSMIGGAGNQQQHSIKRDTAFLRETGWCMPQGNIELMTKKKVLDFKPAAAI
jgi:hypothetical protein